MRFVDDWLGMLLCSLIGRIIQIKNYFLPIKTEIDTKKVKTILCQKYFGMGTILHAIPLIRALKQHYPHAKIIFMTLESNREIVQLIQMADEVLTIRLDSLGIFIRGVLSNIMYLIQQRVDISIDLEFFSKFTMIVSFLCNAKIRVGLHQKRIRPEGIMTHNIYYNHYKHISDIYFAFTNAFGIERKQEYFTSYLPSLRSSQEKVLRNKFGLKHDVQIVIINVNASELFKFRRWPSNYFIELIELLIQRYPNFYYILIGGKSDCKYVEEIYQSIDNRNDRLINCAGKTNIKELVALIEMAYLMISNDSGPMHIASLCSVNLVAFFGPETPVVYGPINENALVFSPNGLYCSPCMSIYDSKKSLYAEECLENECLTNVKPKEVFEMIENRFLNQNKMKE